MKFFRPKQAFIIILTKMLSVAMMSCSGPSAKTVREESFKNGKLKATYDYRGSTMVSSFHYDSLTGKMFSERYYRNDTIVGFRDYDESGKVNRSGQFNAAGQFEIQKYFPNGQVQEKQTLTKSKVVVEVEDYFETGERDLSPYPYVFLPDVKKGENASLYVKVVNLSLDSYFNVQASRLTVGYDLDTVDKVPMVRDTLAVVPPEKELAYNLKFKPRYAGKNTIYWQLQIKRNLGDSATISTFLSREDFVVID